MATTNYKLFFKIAAVTVFTFMIAGAVFIFKTDNEKIVTKQNFENEKTLILKKLNRLQDSIRLVLNQNNSYKTELVAQNVKIAGLIQKISGSSIENTAVTDIKKDYSSEMQSLRNEVASLRSSNKVLLQQNANYKRDIAALKAGHKPNQAMALQSNAVALPSDLINKESITLKFKDENISKIIVSNLRTNTFIIDKSGYMLASDKSHKANMVKVSFEVSGNKNVNFLHKEYYIQIIDSENNVVGVRKTKKFGSDELTYSANYPLTFRNEPIEASVNVDLVDAEKGSYAVSVFDNEKIMSKSSFVLR